MSASAFFLYEDPVTYENFIGYVEELNHDFFVKVEQQTQE